MPCHLFSGYGRLSRRREDRSKSLCILALLNEADRNYLSGKENEQLGKMYFLFSVALWFILSGLESRKLRIVHRCYCSADDSLLC